MGDDKPFGEFIGPYRLQAVLGLGGMGEVFLALDERFGRQVAIKRVRTGPGLSSSTQELLLREARATASLNHPAIVQVYDLVQDEDDGIGIVMEYVVGRSLSSLIGDPSLTPAAVVRLGREIAEGLAHAHASGFVHRDLKAENVMVTSSGHAKILDFGLVKPVSPGSEHSAEFSVAGTVFGTLRSMSPEQARGEDVDARSDLFSLGVLLYEMLSGRSPFLVDSLLHTLQRILAEAPAPLATVRPDLPSPLTELVERLLAKDREDRPQTAGEVARSLSEISHLSDLETAAAGAHQADWSESPATETLEMAPPRRRRGSWRPGSYDEVLVGISLPGSLSRGEEFVARFAAYRGDYRRVVRRAIQQEAPSSKPRLDLGHCRWRRGTRVTVCCAARHVDVANPVQTFEWNGSWHLLRFDAKVSEEADATSLILRFEVSVEGLPVMSLRPEIELATKNRSGATAPSFTEETAPSSAFASYARQDRRDVLGRIRSLQIFADIDVFLDCLSIRPGEQWKQILRREIEQRDLFWLFWSRAAMVSKYVDWEWRTAFNLKSLSCIQPHPLEPAEEAPPPEELSSLQFGALYETYLVASKEAWFPRRFRMFKRLFASKLAGLLHMTTNDVP